MKRDSSEKTYPGRPPRLSRVFDRTPLYFVTFNTWQRRKLLSNDAVHTAFRAYAEKNVGRGFAVGRYVIMPDHVHLFVRVGVEQKLMPYIRLMKQSITKVLKERCRGGSMNRPEQEQVVHRTTATKGDEALHGSTATVRIWQPGFFDHVMRTHESYAGKWEYVRMNPVRAGLVEDADAWRFQGELETIRFD